MTYSLENENSRGKFRLDIKKCIINECDGELAEISHYERNNWVTFEVQCNTCGRKFVVKIEL